MESNNNMMPPRQRRWAQRRDGLRRSNNNNRGNQLVLLHLLVVVVFSVNVCSCLSSCTCCHRTTTISFLSSSPSVRWTSKIRSSSSTQQQQQQQRTSLFPCQDDTTKTTLLSSRWSMMKQQQQDLLKQVFPPWRIRGKQVQQLTLFRKNQQVCGGTVITTTEKNKRQQQQEQQMVCLSNKTRKRIVTPSWIVAALRQHFQKSTNGNIWIHRIQKPTFSVVVALLSFWIAVQPRNAWALGGAMGSKGPIVPLARKDLISISLLWFGLFGVLALLHSCEIAITTLYPWKVREIAEEEERSQKASGGRVRRGTFRILNDDITRVLTTILVTSTACSVFATTIFTHLAASLFGTRGERYGAIALTALTLFFVELLPKSIGVTNAEVVARLMVPPVNVISTVVSPLGISLSFLAKKTLQMVGLNAKNNDSTSGVSDSQLRLIVTGALDSGTIDHGEQEMIQGVLNLQDRRVREIMRPRVEIVAVPNTMSVAKVLAVVRESGYSRIPVFDGEIDNIVGIVLAKSVLDYFVNGVLVNEVESATTTATTTDPDSDHHHDISSSHSPPPAVLNPDLAKLYSAGRIPGAYVRSLTSAELASRMSTSIADAGLIESCYFVPDTANGWSVLQEMRRRRVHMAVVVDEFGGTEGLVSLEDIVEEVVGEIYDEDDDEDFEFSEESITLQEDGTFLIRGDADLEDCHTILGLQLDDDETLKEFATLSGFLCSLAGEIPQTGDFIMSRGWCFEVMHADDKKILQVKVERLIGGYDEQGVLDSVDNPLRRLLKRKAATTAATDVEILESGDDNDEGVLDSELEGTAEDEALMEEEIKERNQAEAMEIERMVQSGERKRSLLEEIRSREVDFDPED